MACFGEILEELRKDKHMNQRALADVLHVSVGTISNYEKGVHYPDIDKIMNLADFFGVTTDYLLGRCATKLSPDVFDELFIGKKSVDDFVTTIRQLPVERKRMLAQLVDDMEFRETVNRYNGKGTQ